MKSYGNKTRKNKTHELVIIMKAVMQRRYTAREEGNASVKSSKSECECCILNAAMGDFQYVVEVRRRTTKMNVVDYHFYF